MAIDGNISVIKTNGKIYNIKDAIARNDVDYIKVEVNKNKIFAESLQTQITSNYNSIGNLQTQITANDRSIEDLQEQITDNDKSIENLQTQIDQIEQDNSNFIVNVTDYSGSSIVDRTSKTAKLPNFAQLDGNGKLPIGLFPSDFSNVIEYDTIEEFPTIGESSTLYILKSNDTIYYWKDIEYVMLGGSGTSDLQLGETDGTAYEGSKGKQNAENIEQLQTTANDLSTSINDVNNQIEEIDENINQINTEQISINNKIENLQQQIDSSMGSVVDVVKNDGTSLLNTTTKIATLPNYAELNSNGKLPTTIMPENFGTDILQYNNINSFPTVGETNKIYIDKENKNLYVWNSEINNYTQYSYQLGEEPNTAFPGNVGAELKTTIDGFDNRIEQIETSNANTITTVNDIQTLVNGYNDRITANENNIAANAVDISAHDKRIKDIEDKTATTIDIINNGTAKAQSFSSEKLITLSGDVSGSTRTDFTGDTEIKVTLSDNGVKPEGYSYLYVNSKGLATKGGQILQIAEQESPSSSLINNGLFIQDYDTTEENISDINKIRKIYKKIDETTVKLLGLLLEQKHLDDIINKIPEKLPNPNKLKITIGETEKYYDGSSEVNVNITDVPTPTNHKDGDLLTVDSSGKYNIKTIRYLKFQED